VTLLIKIFKKMKKKLLGGIAMLAIAGVSAANVVMNSQNNELSSLEFANVEALACTESIKISGSIITVTVCGRTTDWWKYAISGILCSEKTNNKDDTCQFTNM
jgi:hypothetical protein